LAEPLEEKRLEEKRKEEKRREEKGRNKKRRSGIFSEGSKNRYRRGSFAHHHLVK
jgi:hypothetical protein